MNQLLTIIILLAIFLNGCSNDQSNMDMEKITDDKNKYGHMINVDETINELRVQAKNEKQLLVANHKNELSDLSVSINKRKAALKAQQDNEITNWKKKRDEEIADLESKGYDYKSAKGFGNPLRKTPAIVKNLISKHQQESSEIRNRHREENQDLSKVEKTERQNIYNRQKTEIDNQRNNANKQIHELIRNSLLNIVKNAKAKQQVEPEKLTTNPYIYEDQVVVIKSIFSNMLSKNEALFGGKQTFGGGLKYPFIVTNVPTTRFTEEKRILLIARVDGNKEFLMPSGNMTKIAHVEFIDSYDSEYKQEDLAWVLNEEKARKIKLEKLERHPP